MNTFTSTWKQNQERVLTENGGVTYDTSANSNVDLFFQIGALRGQGTDRLYRLFAKAYGENQEIATRIMLWARDVRGGAGERKIFRDLLLWMEKNARDTLRLVLPKVPELGRWDDLLVFETSEFQNAAFEMVSAALRAGDGLCAKWMPRKGVIANSLRKFMGFTPKQYRKLLVELTRVVEQQMCAKEWDKIDYQKVPSLAQSRYSKAFLRHDEERYRQFGEKAKAYAQEVESAAAEGREVDASIEKVKINAGAVFPYDVLKPLFANSYYGRLKSSTVNLDTIRAQWATLPNYVGKKSILPIVDTSGSMYSSVGGNLTCMAVAVSLGLYLSTKNRGDFKNIFMTFSETPKLVHLKGDDIVTQVQQLSTAEWGMNTNLSAAFAKVLSHAVKNNVPQEDLPEFIMVLSDMEFDAAAQGRTAYEDYVSKFEASGYRAPKLIWWNIQSRHDNVPVKFNQHGTALVSGFSPSLVKNIISGAGIDPIEMMLNVVMDERYDFKVAA